MKDYLKILVLILKHMLHINYPLFNQIKEINIECKDGVRVVKFHIKDGEIVNE